MKSEVVSPKKIKLRAFREHTHLPAGHDGKIRYSKTFESLTVQRDRESGILNTGLTEEDERRLEKAMNLSAGTLSRYNREWWGKFEIKVPKNGIEFDLTFPMDEIRYKICMVHQEVAKNEAAKLFTPFANYVLSSEEDENREVLKVIEKKTAAFAKFNDMTIAQMKEYLLVHGKKVTDNTSEEFIKSQVGRVVEETPAEFLKVVTDPNFKMKIFLSQCVAKNVLSKQSTKYVLPGGDIIGYTLEQTIDYLKNPENQEIYLMLKAHVEASK